HSAVVRRMREMVAFYNAQVDKFERIAEGKSKDQRASLVDGFVDRDQRKISWSTGLKQDLLRGARFVARPESMRVSMYRPFCKQHLYFAPDLIERPGQMRKLFPSTETDNIAIAVTGIGNRVAFSCLITDVISDYHMVDASGGSQYFPLHVYEKD